MSYMIRFNEEAPRELRKFLSSMHVTAAMNSVGESSVALQKRKFIQRDCVGRTISSEPQEGWFLTNFDGVPFYWVVLKVQINPQEHPFLLKRCDSILRTWDPVKRGYNDVKELTLL